MRKFRGCKLAGTPPNPLPLWKLDGEDVYYCPRSLVNDEAIYILNLYIECRKLGRLPFEGSYMSQPNKVNEIFQIVEETVEELIKEKHGRK